MKRWWWCSLLCLLEACNRQIRPEHAVAEAPQILQLAASVKFEEAAVSIEKWPEKIARLNPGFNLGVQYASGAAATTALPPGGVVDAKVTLRGLPVARGLPDGDYYLWLGPASGSPRGLLARVDGSLVQEVEVVVRSVDGTSPPGRARYLRSEIEQGLPPALDPDAGSQLGGLEQRWWRLICTYQAAGAAGGAASELCVRLPAN